MIVLRVTCLFHFGTVTSGLPFLGSKADSGGGESVPNNFPTHESLGVRLVEWYPDLESDLSEGTLAHALLEIILPAAVAEYHETIKVTHQSGGLPSNILLLKISHIVGRACPCL